MLHDESCGRHAGAFGGGDVLQAMVVRATDEMHGSTPGAHVPRVCVGDAQLERETEMGPGVDERNRSRDIDG